MVTKVSFVSIPARIMTVTSIKRDVVTPDGERVRIKVGWRSSCESCRQVSVFMLHQHHLAVAATRSHSCYSKG